MSVKMMPGTIMTGYGAPGGQKAVTAGRIFPPGGESVRVENVVITHGDALDHYAWWEPPTCILSDGPYGLGKFPGDPTTPRELPDWYAPHVAAWSARARANTTLWFWCTEIGWALVHPLLDRHDWEYAGCHVWDKGLAHIAGNCNSRKQQSTPVVTEIVVRYTRRLQLAGRDGRVLPLQAWLRHEWARSGLPWSQANVACGVRHAASRKYLTADHRWYRPPPEAMARLASYANRYGDPGGRPYFSVDGTNPVSAECWEQMRPKWHHRHGLTNVWRIPPLHGAGRWRDPAGRSHAAQKPVPLMALPILLSTDPGDVVWEPFGGLCSGAVAAMQAQRHCFAAEVNPVYFRMAVERLRMEKPGSDSPHPPSP